MKAETKKLAPCSRNLADLVGEVNQAHPRIDRQRGTTLPGLICLARRRQRKLRTLESRQLLDDNT